VFTALRREPTERSDPVIETLRDESSQFEAATSDLRKRQRLAQQPTVPVAVEAADEVANKYTTLT